jgi:hypothetical protein
MVKLGGVALAWICRLTAVFAAEVWDPGLVTVADMT